MATQTKIFKLGDVCHSVSSNGSLIKGKQIQEYRDGLYPAFSATGQDIWREEYENEGSAIIVSAVGARCGKCFRADGKWTAIANTHVIFPNQSISRDYIFYVLNNENFWVKGGAAQPFVKVKDSMRIKTVSVPVDEYGNPDLKEQERLVSLLKESENLIEKRLKTNQKIEEILPSLFVKMFGDPSANQMDWTQKKIGDFALVETGSTPNRSNQDFYENGTIPWIKTTEVRNSYIDNADEFISPLAVRETNCKIFPVNTILIAMYGQGITRGRVGLMRINGATNQACAAILPQDNINSIFMYQQLLMRYDELRALGRGGNQPNLNLSLVKNFKVIIPPIELQNRFADLVKEIEIQKDKQKESTQKIDDLFNTVMAKSFS